MEKIKFIIDTAGDIPDEDLREYNIDMPSVPITVDGESYFERKSFTIQEFYDILAKSKEIPATSRVPAADFVSCYKGAFWQNYTDIIVVTINAGGSGTYESAAMAREQFFQEMPNAKETMRIHLVDSKTYTMAFGLPVVEGAKMARAGKSVDEILLYLHDFFDRVEVYLACWTLEYAKKSGRISAAAAFVGEVLGLRPVISLIDGETKIVDRVRGEKQLIPRIVKCYEDNCDDRSAPVFVAYGAVDEYGQALKAALEKKIGRSIPMHRAGASIVINAGPRIAAVVFCGKKRNA